MFSFYSTGCKESQQHALAQKSLKFWTSLLNKVVLDIHYLFNTRVWVTIDYMHSTLLGVVKMLVNLWFDKQHHKKTLVHWKVCKRSTRERCQATKLYFTAAKEPYCECGLPQGFTTSVIHFTRIFQEILVNGKQPYFKHYILLMEAIYIHLKDSAPDWPYEDIQVVETFYRWHGDLTPGQTWHRCCYEKILGSMCNFFYWLSPSVIYRDVDNSRKPGKLPGCEHDFSGCKALLISPKCF